MQRIFVGDVQGCADELGELLARARRAFGRRFELWSVGDVLNRGPSSRRALDAVHELVEQGRGRYVLGNHELALIRTAWGQRRARAADTLDEILEAPDADEWIEWIRRRPLVETDALGERPFAMVHAAVAPDWDLDALRAHARAAEARLGHADRAVAERFLAGADPRADPEGAAARDALARLTTCRSVAPDGRWSPDEPTGGTLPWHRAWRERGHGYGVVYGHWSIQGLHVAPGLRGLDTGCVHHGRGHVGLLTAWLPDERRLDPFALPDEGFWQARARARYYRGDRGGPTPRGQA